MSKDGDDARGTVDLSREAATTRESAVGTTWLIVYLKGICMGAADAVPGVSGGTIALVVGI